MMASDPSSAARAPSASGPNLQLYLTPGVGAWAKVSIDAARELGWQVRYVEGLSAAKALGAMGAQGLLIVDWDSAWDAPAWRDFAQVCHTLPTVVAGPLQIAAWELMLRQFGAIDVLWTALQRARLFRLMNRLERGARWRGAAIEEQVEWDLARAAGAFEGRAAP